MLPDISNLIGMKRLLLCGVLFGVVFPVFAQEETNPVPPTPTGVPSPVIAPSITPSVRKAEWEDRFGLGISQISVSPNSAQSGQTNNLTLFSLRYGLSERFILEALLGGTSGTQVGSDASGNPFNDPYWAYCYAFGVKTVLIKAFDGFWVQVPTRFLYYENSTQRSIVSDVLTDHYQFLSVSVGLGFEYFLPFLKNLSLETTETVEFDNSWETFTDTPRNTSQLVTTRNYSPWVFKVVSPGFNLTSLSIHYYF